MGYLAAEAEAVAPLLCNQIKGYEDLIDIVERPSVGLLTAPVEICTLIHKVLGYSLYSFVQGKSKRVYVRCRRLTPSRLIMEVAADHAWPPPDEVRASIMLGQLNQDAHHLGGEIVTGGVMNGVGRPSSDVFFRLIVSIPS